MVAAVSGGSDGSLLLGDAGWFQALVLEAAHAPSPERATTLPRRLGALDRDLHEALWTGGALLGAPHGGRRGPVSARTDAESAFIELLRFELSYVALLVRAVRPGQAEPRRLRLTLAAVSAAFAGELAAAVVLDEAASGAAVPLSERDERRLFGIAGARLLRRAYLQGNPPGGLPLHALLSALDARLFVRLAAAQLVNRGPLRRRASRMLESTSRLRALGIELLAGAFGPGRSPEAKKTLQRQVRSAALTSNDRRALLRRLEAPRRPVELVPEVPFAVWPALLEQLVLAALVDRRWTGEVRAVAAEAALAAGLSRRDLDAAEARAAAFLLEHRSSAQALAAPGEPEEWRGTLTGAMDAMTEAAHAIANEVRETGELGTLLARLAAGETLDPGERARMREQLIDVAKVVPSLAIFAAPGGMLLLPLILKLLPFDLRPSSFQHRPAPRALPAKAEPPEAA